MSKEKDDKPGGVFSFAPSKNQDERRDDTFTIPAFLRRGAESAKGEAKPQSAPAWKDDDFARIAATVEEPRSEPQAKQPTSETASADPANPVEEHAPPVELPEPSPASDHALHDTQKDPTPIIAAPPEDKKPPSMPLFGGMAFQGVRPILRDASEKYVSENEALHRLRGVPFQPAKPDILLRPQSEIRVDPKARPSDFERVEPRLTPTEHVSDIDVPQRWRLGPAISPDNGYHDNMNMNVSAASWDDGDPSEGRSVIRWALLALVVAAGGYALAHQLDQPGDIAALWSSTAPHEQVATLPPAGPLLSPPTAIAAPSSAPAPAAPIAVAPASNPEVAALPIVPDIKPAPPQTAKSVPPMQPTRDEITPRALQAHAEPSAPVTLAPGPRTLSASNTASSASVTASGELVLDIQQRLAALGYPDVPLNGQLGTSTRSAIMAFQRNSGLPMTGSIDSELLNRLRRTSPAAMRLVKGPEAIVPR